MVWNHPKTRIYMLFKHKQLRMLSGVICLRQNLIWSWDQRFIGKLMS